MKQLIVKKIDATPADAAQVGALLDSHAIDFEPIDCVDWAKDYPYAPSVGFRMAHTGSTLLIEYRVSEEHVAAVAPHDNGHVWEDSCCEFFFKPAGGNVYYNVETNCAGTVLVGCGPQRENRELAPASVLEGISRWSSLGREPFALREAPATWSMALIIPVQTAFRSGLTTFSGARMTANFYKCGDHLPKPHFLSWNPIDLESPDFHRPDFFGQLLFEP